MPEKLARSVVVTPCCRHHSLTERPLLRHSWICVAHSCSSARCFNSALVILTPHNTTVAKPFATFRYYCLMCVYARLGLTVTKDLNLYEFFHIRSDQIIGGNILARCSRPLIPISAARHYTSILLSCRLAAIRCSRCRQALFQDRSAALSFTGVRGKDYLISKGRPYRPGILVCTKCQSFPAPERGEMYRYCQPHRGSKNRS